MYYEVPEGPVRYRGFGRPVSWSARLAILLVGVVVGMVLTLGTLSICSPPERVTESEVPRSSPEPVEQISSDELPMPEPGEDLVEWLEEATENLEIIPEAELYPVPTKAPRVDPKDLEHLAIAIYREGGGDAVCDECRFRIGDVILNRIADPRFPDTLDEVLLQPGQYGNMSRTGIEWPERSVDLREQEAVTRAYGVADQLLRGEHHSELYGAGYIYQSTEPLGSSEGRVYCCGTYFSKG